jgi:hypothetical protein
MKTIPEEVYAKLDHTQRITATILAEARGDGEELRKLVQTAPKLQGCTITDPSFSDRMKVLTPITMAHELDVANLCLKWFVQITGFKKRDKEAPITLEAIQQMDAADDTACGIKSAERAYELFSEYVGVSVEEMKKFGAPRSPMVEIVVNCCMESADEEEAAAMFEAMKTVFEQAA